jgi:hypothetical protein
MSKEEKTSLAYALATNLAKHGKPQSPTNERKLTKGEENKKEKYMSKFKKAFDLEEINRIKEALKNPEKADLNKDGKLSSYEKKRGAAIEKAVMKEAPGSTLTLSQADMDKLHKDGKLEIDGHTIKFSIKEDMDIGHQDNEPHMLKKDLYRIAKYASELYKMVDQFDVEGQEVDFPQWWQAKIITSKETMVKAKHYLDGELAVDKIDNILDTLDEKKDDEEQHKVLSTAELDRLAALPPTHPSHKKDRRYKRLTQK